MMIKILLVNHKDLSNGSSSGMAWIVVSGMMMVMTTAVHYRDYWRRSLGFGRGITIVEKVA